MNDLHWKRPALWALMISTMMAGFMYLAVGAIFVDSPALFRTLFSIGVGALAFFPMLLIGHNERRVKLAYITARLRGEPTDEWVALIDGNNVNVIGCWHQPGGVLWKYRDGEAKPDPILVPRL